MDTVVELSRDTTDSALVLQSASTVDDMVIQLWDISSQTTIIGETTISFLDYLTGVEFHSYTVLPDAMEYNDTTNKKICFPRTEIEDLQFDLHEAIWSEESSAYAARNTIFYGK